MYKENYQNKKEFHLETAYDFLIYSEGVVLFYESTQSILKKF